MKKGFSAIEVTSEAGYEVLYLSLESKFKWFLRVFNFILAIHLVFLTIIAAIGLISFDGLYGFIIARAVQSILISLFSELRWHLVTNHNYLKMNPVKQPKILPYWVAVLATVLTVISILANIGNFASEVFYDYEETSFWPYIVEGILNLLGAIIMCFVLHYLLQYFRWYRWTWEELQLSPQERKARYKAKKLAERQKKREAREAKRAAAHDRREAGGGVFFRNSERPAAKTVKSQTDRRAELENLKKLYDEGLIDEEEYKKAREKTLGI